ncbi:MAG: DUF3822 family protein [Bacteroidales bacterium]|nr:DUF3822 family protein [Bacteroidales bacterium]
MIAPSKPTLSLIDKSFKQDYSKNFQMTIRIAPDGFSFVIFSPEKQRFVGLETYSFSARNEVISLVNILDEIIMKHAWIAYPYQQVRVLVENNHMALVPNPLYDEKEKGTYLAFAQAFQENSRISSDLLKTADASVVYYISNVLMAKIKDLWANARVHHISSAFIESVLITNKNKQFDSAVFVQVRNRCFDMLVIEDQKFKFYNIFRFNTKEDFIYFLLFAMEQQQLNPEKTPLILSGAIEQSSAIFEISERYIRNISFETRNKNFDYSYVFETLIWHHNSLLFNTLQCEL